MTPERPEIPDNATEQVAALSAMFGDDTPAEPKDAAERAWKAYYAAYSLTQAQEQAANLPIDGRSPLGRMFSAGHRLASVWERRAKAAEKTLRMLLASDALVDADLRALATTTLHGKDGRSRDRALLSDTERQLIADYRKMSAEDRQMFRRMMTRICGLSDSAGQ